MPRFLVSGLAADGAREPRFIEAETVTGARDAALAAGLSEVVVHDDEFSATLRDQARAELPQFPRNDPARELRLKRPAPARDLVWNAIKSRAIFLTAIIAWLAWIIVRGPPFRATDGFAVAALVLFCWSLYVALAPSLLYRRILHATALARHDEVLALVARMRRAPRTARTKTLDSDLDFREATMLAVKGRLDAGVARVAKWKDALQPGHYEGRLASLYQAAKRHDLAAQTQRDALAATPGRATSQIDLATTLALRLGRYDEADALLAQAEAGALSETALPWARMCRGAIEIGRGDPAAAVAPLAEALRAFEGKYESPLYWVVTAWTLNLLAIALAQTGDKTAARVLAERARPILELHREADMIAACDAALAP